MLGGLVVVFVIFGASARSALAEESYPQRKVIGIKSAGAGFEEVVKKICDPDSKMIPDDRLERSNIYFRLTNRDYVLKDGKFNPNAILGGGSYVFMTVPEAGFGRSLYGIYSDLGYDAEGILRQRDVHMVALVIRYDPEDVRFSPARGGLGELSGEDYNRFVYVPTWRNGFKLFARLAEKEQKPDPKNPSIMKFNSEADRDLALFFPAERRKHISNLPYTLLRVVGGPDWNYRQLLENKMSMNSHFRGVGVTENTLSPANDRKGLPEFVGPNRKLSDLAEFVVIDIGKMEFKEVHDTE